MLLGAVTAAGTFYVLMLTDFRGLQELGFISGTAILLSWVAMMTVFPAVLVLVDRRHADRVRPARCRARSRSSASTCRSSSASPLSEDGPGRRRRR